VQSLGATSSLRPATSRACPAAAHLIGVYIDGNHLYEYVRNDLEIFATKVKSGGLITGDDYGVLGWWRDGVTRAVDEFVAQGTCEPVHLGRQFVLRTV
jgi:hypothetical protein